MTSIAVIFRRKRPFYPAEAGARPAEAAVSQPANSCRCAAPAVAACLADVVVDAVAEDITEARIAEAILSLSAKTAAPVRGRLNASAVAPETAGPSRN